MKLKLLIILLVLMPPKLYADYGFTYQGDLNGDHIDDYIYSGPSSLFGNGGGPCLIKVSVPDNKYKEKIVHCGNRVGIILDSGDNSKPRRIWGYSHFTAGSGSISTLTLDGKFTHQYLWVYPGATGAPDSIDSLILKVINDKGQLVKFEQIKSNYVPPETPCGLQWGKGC